MAQVAPRTVCLYRTLTSRHVRKYSSSLNSHSSRSFKATQPREGLMMVTGMGEPLPRSWSPLHLTAEVFSMRGIAIARDYQSSRFYLSGLSIYLESTAVWIHATRLWSPVQSVKLRPLSERLWRSLSNSF